MIRNWLIWFVGLYCVNKELFISTKGEVIQTNDKLETTYNRSDENLDVVKYSGFNVKQEDKIVAEVNSLKGRLHIQIVSNKVKVEWSDKLAKLAKDWGDQCKREFGPPGCEKKFSQNRGSINKSFDEIHLINEWARANYTYETNTCNGICDSYKNIMWAESYAIGCSKSSCENLGSGHFMICNIYPPIDVNKRPYLIGYACGDCPTGYPCKEGFCDKEDKSVPKEIINCIHAKGYDEMNVATESGNGLIAEKATLLLMGLLYPLLID
ncbi:GLIPR1-like protein 1 [Centruroides sculpturatus]|uniref:GLIPR1-like protein 1 n=1 Tax=Centruroides sculpturatus TaxID=218467 RepID=UPI000C6DAD24|nr:GLIPR1-like protein 1 [Centruroides sculpturatus]